MREEYLKASIKAHQEYRKTEIVKSVLYTLAAAVFVALIYFDVINF